MREKLNCYVQKLDHDKRQSMAACVTGELRQAAPRNAARRHAALAALSIMSRAVRVSGKLSEHELVQTAHQSFDLSNFS